MASKGEALIEAAKRGNVNKCRRLVEEEGADVHFKDISYFSPIIWACSKGHLDVVEFLVSKGANIHDKDISGFDCLLWACELDHLDIAEFLVSKGANVHEKYVEGANIHDRDNIGCNCLMATCGGGGAGYLDIAGFLMSIGASIHEMDYDSNKLTCFSLALNHKRMRLLYRLRKWPTTMAILVLQELALIYIIDSESVIDLHQYLGRPDDYSKLDNEENYSKDEDGNVLDPDD